MDIYYLFNSGFTIEIGEDALIIDYYRGSLGKPWLAPLSRKPSEYRNVYVFSSHAHGDHYNRRIFDWLSERADIKYVLSSDIRHAVPAALLKKEGPHSIAFMEAGDALRAGTLDVKAYGSTDEGVSFHITAEDGTSLFHAGDLNYWHWRDESTEGEIAEARDRFAAELAKIRAGIPKLDVAFFPVDPRMGSDYYRGAIMFCEQLKPAHLVPMHFSTVFSPPSDFFREASPYTKVAQIGSGAEKIVF